MTYSPIVMDHFGNPRNVGIPPAFNRKGTAGDPNAGLYMVIYLLVENGTIDQIGYQTYGCAAAIACGSMLTEMAKGRSTCEALSLTPKELIDRLAGLPLGKGRCADLAIAALADAIKQGASS